LIIESGSVSEKENFYKHYAGKYKSSKAQIFPWLLAKGTASDTPSKRREQRRECSRPQLALELKFKSSKKSGCDCGYSRGRGEQDKEK
jgi:hypothetical protein